MSTLIGIATHTVSKGPIQTHSSISVSLEKGLENDFRGAQSRHTQITVMSHYHWQLACATVDAQIDWTHRRANLLVDKIDFNASLIGQQLQIGSVLLEITCETDPCERMEALHPGLKSALTPNWHGGARCRVLREGEIQLGDKVRFLKRY